MSTIAGLLFLFGGVTLFVASILLLVARERRGHRPSRSVSHFQRTRHALNKIHTVQTALNSSARARARAMHPSGQRPAPDPPSDRKSA